MRRVRTDEQIFASGYISQSEIRRLYGIGQTNAKRAFDKASEIDNKVFGRNRVFVNMVRLSSIRDVLKIDPEANEKAV